MLPRPPRPLRMTRPRKEEPRPRLRPSLWGGPEPEEEEGDEDNERRGGGRGGGGGGRGGRPTRWPLLQEQPQQQVGGWRQCWGWWWRPWPGGLGQSQRWLPWQWQQPWGLGAERSCCSKQHVFPRIRVFSSESVLPIRWPEYWSFSSTISPSSEYSGLISFRIDWFDLLAVQGILEGLLQHHDLKASVLRHPSFFMVQLSHLYMTTGKTIALTVWTFVSKVVSLLFNMLPLKMSFTGLCFKIKLSE